MKKYKRIPEYGFFGGVCSGLAYYLDMPTWVIRIFFITVVFSLIGFIPYILVWTFSPEYKKTPSDYIKKCE